MTSVLPRLASSIAIAAAFLGFVTSAGAKSEEWKNAKGETFEAKPADILGPWALFDDSTLLPLSLLSDADCVRFYEGLKDKPSRASDWKNATSTISSELYGRLLRYKGDSLVADEEGGRPEPEFYMIFYVSDDKVQSWDELRRSTPALYARLEKDYPTRFQGVVYGLETESMQDYMDVAANTKGDWMFTQFQEEMKMRATQKMTPSNLYGIVVMTRDGIPLFGPESSTDEQVKATFDKFSGLLSHMRPDDIRAWKDRAHYLRAVQPVAFASGHSDPVLVGNPLDDAKLRGMKVYKLDASFQIAADGTIKDVVVNPDGLAPNMVAMFTSGFKRACLFVPAVDHGKFVDGTYAYHVELAP
jgi:hypothetical protein